MDLTMGIEGRIKIYPILGLASIVHRHVGAWRVWQLARHIDQAGSGKVTRGELVQLMKTLELEPRTSRRWIADALKVGLFIPGPGDALILVGAVKACELFYVTRIGNATYVNLRALTHKGWRSLTFEAYNSTLRGPMSQRAKQAVTRVKSRTQRNYLRAGLGVSRTNYARRSEPADHAQGLRELRGLAVFENGRGGIIQRLPDQRLVPWNVAKPALKGRSRKIQTSLNSLSFLGRGNHKGVRIYFENQNDAFDAAERIGQSENKDKPQEVFYKAKVEDTATSWEAVNV